MKLCDGIMSMAVFAGKRRYVRNGILAVLPLVFFGCSTVPRPLIIKHERAQSASASVVPDKRKEPADKVMEAQVDLSKNNNMISAEEAARFKEYVARAVAEKGAVANSETDDKERIEKIAAGITRELMKELQEQVKKQVREELLAEIRENEKEQIKASVAEEVKKDLQQAKSERQGDQPGEIRKAESTAAAPEWLKRIRFGGDIRLRYESDRFDKNNGDFVVPSNPGQLMNTKIDQDRYKYRVRAGAAMDVNDQVEAVISLSTGNTSTPVSTNSVIGDFMNKDNVLFDLAYIKWQPSEPVTIYGGRMPNPWFSSDLVWSRDLNFEGFAFNLKKPVTESWTPFLTAGAFPLQQNDFTQHGKWLAAGQLGLERKSREGIGVKAGAAYYYFSNITGILNNPLHPGATDWTAPLFQQKGNTLFNINPTAASPADYKLALASEFKELNLTGALDIGLWDPVHIVLLGDYVNNLGFSKSAVARRTGISNLLKETQGYQFGVTVGYPATQAAGQWKAYLHYKRLEADAVVDAFTDADFHLGGTNAKGWVLGADYALLKNFWLTFRWLTANEISGPPLSIDVLQVDINARF